MFHPDPLSADTRRLVTIPRVPEAALLRPRLSLERTSRITSVWASPGAGKTTLLVQWANEMQRGGRTVAWVGLPADGTQLLTLRELVGASLARAGSTGFPIDLGDTIEPITVFFDDLHRLRNREDAAWLADLCRSHPANVHLVLAGRYPPPSLSGLPLAQDLSELRSRDLAFSDDETALLLESKGIQLGEAGLRSVQQRTEGWAAAIVLLTGWLVHTGQRTALPDDFGGDHRAVADYLVTEVLNEVAPEARDFLLTTAAVDSLTVPLAVALTGRSDSGAVLADLESTTSLISHSDDTESVYVFHTVLLSYLRAEARRRDFAGYVTAERVAAQWYRRHSRATTALDVLLRTDAVDDILDLLHEEGMGLIFSGNSPVVRRALDHLAALNVNSVATHLLDVMITAPYLPDSVRADFHLAAVEASVPSASTDLRLIHAALVVMRADRSAATAALDTLDALEQDSRTGNELTDSRVLDALIFCALARAVALGERGRIPDALDTIRPALASAHRSHRRRWLDLNLVDVAATLATQAGGWAEAMEFQNLILSDAKPSAQSPDLASARVTLAQQLARFHAGFDPRLSDLDGVLHSDDHHLDVPLTVHSRALRLLVLLDSGGDERAYLDELHQLLHIHGRRNPLVLAMCAYPYLSRTLRLHDRYRSGEVRDFICGTLGAESLEGVLATAHFAGVGGRFDSVESSLERALDNSHRAWDHATLVSGWLLLAGWAEQSGREVIVDFRLLRALAVAEPMRARRPFLNDGAQGVALLEPRLGRLGPYDDFGLSVVAAARRSRLSFALPGAPTLTQKERDILRELPRHQSISEIAHKQGLSPNTIKTHLRSVYQKLDVSGRAAAVDKATEQGLL